MAEWRTFIRNNIYFKNKLQQVFKTKQEEFIVIISVKRVSVMYFCVYKKLDDDVNFSTIRIK